MEKLKTGSQKIKNFISHHKKLSIILLIFILTLSIVYFYRNMNKKDFIEISSNEVATLSKGDLTNSIHETGSVTPSKSVDIYAEKSLPILNLYVKEGDQVEEGDMIAELDSSEIRHQIDSKEEARNTNRKSINMQISQGKNRLQEAIQGKKEGTNPSLVGANTSVTSAYDAWQSAEKAYNDYKKSLDEGYHPEVLNENNSKKEFSYQEKNSLNKYKQLENERDYNINKISEYRDLIAKKEKDRKYWQDYYNDLDRQSTELSIKSNKISREIEKVGRNMEAQSDIQNSSPSLSPGTNGNLTIPNNTNTNKNYDLEIQQYQNSIDTITRQQDEIKREMGRAQEMLSEVTGDINKYNGEVEALQKEISAQNQSMDQISLELSKTQDDLKSNQENVEKNNKSRLDQLKTLRQNADHAHHSYLGALESLKSTKVQVNNEIRTLEDSLKTTKAGLNSADDTDLKYLAKDLEKTMIKAPVSGTITSLNGKEGLVPTEAIAKIETTENLNITSHVKEYNIKDVQVGTKVMITSDAVEGKEFKGRVISISPTPEEGKQGENSGEVYYKTMIHIQTEDMEAFTPGMSVRVKYILSEEKDTFTVPSTALFERDGKSYILGLEEKGDTKNIVQFEVKTGLENDFETAIQGKKLKPGMDILTSPAGYSEGQNVMIMYHEGESGD
ncbi:MAG: efflux RND transporter periplasmic adaptor subunit [Tissierellia bacterium]|nr:efflux RND transporter periplasmic adaptor subunit [Tissierellia bacterium]